MSGKAAAGLIPNLCSGFSPSPQANPWIFHVLGAEPSPEGLLEHDFIADVPVKSVFSDSSRKLCPSLCLRLCWTLILSTLKMLFFLGRFFCLLGITSAPPTANPGNYLDFLFRFGQVFYRLYKTTVLFYWLLSESFESGL